MSHSLISKTTSKPQSFALSLTRIDVRIEMVNIKYKIKIRYRVPSNQKKNKIHIFLSEIFYGGNFSAKHPILLKLLGTIIHKQKFKYTKLKIILLYFCKSNKKCIGTFFAFVLGGGVLCTKYILKYK